MEQKMADPEEQFDELHWEMIDILRKGRVTPSYLSELTGESRQLISQRLRDLRLAGAVERVHTGLYELDEDPNTGNGTDVADSEPREPTEATDAADTVETGPVDTSEQWETTEPSELASEFVDEASRDWVGEYTGERREAAQQAVQWLQEDGGPASGSDFREALHGSHSVPSQSEDTWWRKTVRPVIQVAVDRGLVEYQHGKHTYEWVGDENRDADTGMYDPTEEF